MIDPADLHMQFLLTMVETDIQRDGEYCSFMVRAGLLRDILKFAIEQASGTLTEGGDVEQAPSDSLSGPTGNAGDAQ